MSFLSLEFIQFAICTLIIIPSALCVCLAKKPVHAVVAMLGVMVPLAAIYVIQRAQFMAVTQIVVYSGAILMMFIFVIMLIGTHKEGIDTKKKPILLVLIVISVLLFLSSIVISILPAFVDRAPDSMISQLLVDKNPNIVAVSLFSKHYFTMHLAGLLLLTSAIGALMLVHSGKKGIQKTQQEVVEEKMREFAENKQRIGQKTIPGVYASSNACNMENISGDTGEVIEDSIFETYKNACQIGKVPAEKIQVIDGSTGEKL